MMSGGVDALVPFNNESGDIIAQKGGKVLQSIQIYKG